MAPPVIQPGDIVNVSLIGARGRVLASFEVLTIPAVGSDYWEFESPTGEVVAVSQPVSVVKVG